MDMHSRTQYLKRMQQRYFQCQSKKEKTSILGEYCKNTHQNRKYVMRKIKSFISLASRRRGGKEVIHDGYVKVALAKLWDIFDEPCGQRLAPLLKTEVECIRQLEEIFISNGVAEKLKRISPRTIERLDTLNTSRKPRRLTAW
ncbi:hypothetical protein CEE34_02225 [Candidatus Aerophobetes bacterium Ae_b3a]|nr:MAG: hypothetical protein CEE34_02225 [Candidatus Aerophobetes bacterium Ae_b3a]